MNTTTNSPDQPNSCCKVKTKPSERGSLTYPIQTNTNKHNKRTTNTSAQPLITVKLG